MKKWIEYSSNVIIVLITLSGLAVLIDSIFCLKVMTPEAITQYLLGIIIFLVWQVWLKKGGDI